MAQKGSQSGCFRGRPALKLPSRVNRGLLGSQKLKGYGGRPCIISAFADTWEVQIAR